MGRYGEMSSGAHEAADQLGLVLAPRAAAREAVLLAQLLAPRGGRLVRHHVRDRERLARGDAAEGAQGEQAASGRPRALLRAHAHHR